MLGGTPIENAYRLLLARSLVPWLTARGVVPDQLTWGGLLLSVTAAAASPWSPVAGAFALLGAGVLDTLDGAVSRATRRASAAGAFLDSTLDRYAEFVALLGAFGRLARVGQAGWGSCLCLFALQGSLMVSYARARAEGLGHTLRGGVFQRPERLLLLAGALLLTPWEGELGLGSGGALLVGLGVLAVGSNATALGRIRRGRKGLRTAGLR